MVNESLRWMLVGGEGEIRKRRSGGRFAFESSNVKDVKYVW